MSNPLLEKILSDGVDVAGTHNILNASRYKCGK
jgi:hypothetical protein